MSGFNDLFKVIGSLLDLVQKMDAAGLSEVNKSGSFQKNIQGQDLQGVYGFSLKLGQEGISRVKTFGNLRAEKENLTVDGVCEPLVDVFDEPDQLLIAAELPGIIEEQVRVEVQNGILIIEAAGDRRVYIKNIPLPQGVIAGQLELGCHNGILEIRVPKG